MIDSVLYELYENKLDRDLHCIEDCGIPNIKNGKTQTLDGTTFGKTGAISCDNGYTLSGDRTVRCEASGSWSASSTCLPKGNYHILEYEPQL